MRNINGFCIRQLNAGGRFAADPHQRTSKAILPPIENLLSRLDSVRQTRPDRWQARCPSHDDRSPSLAISENSDGTILIRCWAGCSADAIVKALGLELRDLFPRTFDYQSTSKGKPPRYNSAEVVRTAIAEATIISLGYRQLDRGEPLNIRDQARVELAVQTIGNLREVIR